MWFIKLVLLPSVIKLLEKSLYVARDTFWCILIIQNHILFAYLLGNYPTSVLGFTDQGSLLFMQKS